VPVRPFLFEAPVDLVDATSVVTNFTSARCSFVERWRSTTQLNWVQLDQRCKTTTKRLDAVWKQ